MYKYMLWDIDGTVLNFEKSQNAAIRALFLKYKIGECTDEMLRVYTDINHKYWEVLERGEKTKSEILVERFIDFFSLYNINVNLAEIFNDDYQVALGDYASFENDAEEMLNYFKGNCKLIAVTNGTKIAQTKKLKTTGLDKIFDSVYISEDVGYEKPNVRYFEHVFSEENIKNKNEVIIIGDSLTSDILGGNNIGIDTCWYNPLNKQKDKNVIVKYEISSLDKLKEIVEI